MKEQSAVAASGAPSLNIVSAPATRAVGSPFVCPGESQPVSEAVHRARLAAGWAACHQCQFNPITTDSNGAGSPTIRRSPSGIRGPWLNALGRSTAALLATVFARQLQQSTFTQTPSTSELSAVASAGGSADGSADVQPLLPLRVVVGYDGSAAAVDLFAGVLPALRRSGCHVMDAGRSSSASLLNLCRRHSELHGAFWLTTAGGRAGDVGLDVFTSDGQPVSVAWRDVGIGVRLPTATPSDQPEADPIQERLKQIRALPPDRNQESTPVPAAASRRRPPQANDPDCWPQLVLPPQFLQLTNRNRHGRISGTLTAVDSESAYRQWLHRWWPDRDTASTEPEPIEIIASTPQTLERLRWLQQTGRGCFHLRPLHSELHFTDSDLPPNRRRPQLIVGADDRTLSVVSAHGQPVSLARLADWINNSPRATAAHVTAHVNTDSDARLLLVDVAPPNQARAHDIIADALATIGLMLTISLDGNIPLRSL